MNNISNKKKKNPVKQRIMIYLGILWASCGLVIIASVINDMSNHNYNDKDETKVIEEKDTTKNIEEKEENVEITLHLDNKNNKKEKYIFIKNENIQLPNISKIKNLKGWIIDKEYYNIGDEIKLYKDMDFYPVIK